MEKIIGIVIVLLIAIFFKTIARFIGFKIMYAFLGTVLFLILFGFIGLISYQLTNSNIPILVISILSYMPWLKKFIKLGSEEELHVHEQDKINKVKVKKALDSSTHIMSKTKQKFASTINNDTTPINKIRQLKSLLNEGIISQEEFEEKKEELLKKV